MFAYLNSVKVHGATGRTAVRSTTAGLIIVLSDQFVLYTSLLLSRQTEEGI